MPLILKDLVRRVAEATRLKEPEARVVVDRMLSDLSSALARGERVELRGLGTFETLDVSGRRGRDWRTGKTVSLPTTRRVVFRPGRSLRPRVLPAKVVDRRGQVMLFDEDAAFPPRAGQRGTGKKP
jgi:nucleoid DNA-binding protein